MTGCKPVKFTNLLCGAAGGALEFLLLSWIHALYCFDYKWGLHNVPLDRRKAAMEEEWAYFAGFGSAMASVACGASFFVGAAVVGIMFPFFIMTAINASPVDAMVDGEWWLGWCDSRAMVFAGQRAASLIFALRWNQSDAVPDCGLCRFLLSQWLVTIADEGGR